MDSGLFGGDWVCAGFKLGVLVVMLGLLLGGGGFVGRVIGVFGGIFWVVFGCCWDWGYWFLVVSFACCCSILVGLGGILFLSICLNRGWFSRGVVGGGGGFCCCVVLGFRIGLGWGLL